MSTPITKPVQAVVAQIGALTSKQRDELAVMLLAMIVGATVAMSRHVGKILGEIQSLTREQKRELAAEYGKLFSPARYRHHLLNMILMEIPRLELTDQLRQRNNELRQQNLELTNESLELANLSTVKTLENGIDQLDIVRRTLGSVSAAAKPAPTVPNGESETAATNGQTVIDEDHSSLPHGIPVDHPFGVQPLPVAPPAPVRPLPAVLAECETRSKEIVADLVKLVAELPNVSGPLPLRERYLPSWKADCKRVRQLALTVGAVEILSDLTPPSIISLLSPPNPPANVSVSVSFSNPDEFTSPDFIASTSYEVMKLWNLLADWCRSRLMASNNLAGSQLAATAAIHQDAVAAARKATTTPAECYQAPPGVQQFPAAPPTTGILTPTGAATRTFLPPAVEEFVFAPFGNGFLIKGFGESGHLSRYKGLHVIARLIQSPREPVSMLELGQADERTKADGKTPQMVLDDEAKTNIKDKFQELRFDLERARKENNTVEVDLASKEIEKLTQHVLKAQGLHQKDRDLNNPWDKLRPKIHNQLNKVYAALRKANPPMALLADHFEQSISSEGGSTFIYRPGPFIQSWQTAQK